MKSVALGLPPRLTMPAASQRPTSSAACRPVTHRRRDPVALAAPRLLVTERPRPGGPAAGCGRRPRGTPRTGCLPGSAVPDPVGGAQAMPPRPARGAAHRGLPDRFGLGAAAASAVMIGTAAATVAEPGSEFLCAGLGLTVGGAVSAAGAAAFARLWARRCAAACVRDYLIQSAAAARGGNVPSPVLTGWQLLRALDYAAAPAAERAAVWESLADAYGARDTASDLAAAADCKREFVRQTDRAGSAAAVPWIRAARACLRPEYADARRLGCGHALLARAYRRAPHRTLYGTIAGVQRGLQRADRRDRARAPTPWPDDVDMDIDIDFDE